MAAATDAPVQIVTDVRYSKRTTERLFLTLPAGTPTNIEHVPTPVTVTSSRGLSTSVHKEGFQTFVYPTQVKDWDSEEEIVNYCYPEAVEVVKRATGAKVATVFDHTIRRATGSAKKVAESREPVFAVHTDYNLTSAGKRVDAFYGDQAGSLKQGRWGIVNVWRPISGLVQDLPLGFIDCTTMAAGDLTGYDVHYPDRVGGNSTVHFNPDHKWYFYDNMVPDEVHVFKQHDSKEDVARFCPHTAFADPRKPEDGYIPRESIELRLFVFYDTDEQLPIVAKPVTAHP